ncbi:MAG TPA: 30S ribosomal protein S9 [Candidatus Nanoarchaeia archaeon]|nr:30S ribosomal protein S9 [Candidatus Nanoarchaeia archaeon]
MKKVIITQGKRKSAIARATLSEGKGKVKVNGIFLDSFSNKMVQLKITEPLVLAEAVAKKVNIDINVRGGGVNGQADAARLAIARALVEFDPALEKIFSDYDRLLLVADVRRKETRKPNDSKARAKRQKSYR